MSYYLEQAGEDDGVDILLAAQTAAMERDGFPFPDCCISIFHSKTLNWEIHIAVLAVACLFADRLPDAVTVGGDITSDQCREAVELANRYLREMMNTPVTCRAEALLDRLSATGISQERQLCAFMNLYLGEITGKTKACLMRCFPAEQVECYCRHDGSRSYRSFRHPEQQEGYR